MIASNTTVAIFDEKFIIIKLMMKNLLFIGVRKLHIKIEPSEVVRSIAVTEDVTIAKLGLISKEEALKLSPDETVTIINNEILNIFRVSSKDEIAAMETKDILAKLDAVFKVRVDGQPHVDYPVSMKYELKVYLKGLLLVLSIDLLTLQGRMKVSKYGRIR